MKKFVGLLAAVILLLVPVTALAKGDTVTVTGNAGYTDVLFSNEYRGFCIDQYMTGSSIGDSFITVEKTEGEVKNNVTGADVSQELKIILTQYFEEYFVSDEQGGYQLDDYKAGTVLQAVMWNYTDNYYIWGEQKNLVEEVDAYDGPEIPDHGYTRTLENGDIITFDFMVLKSDDSSVQDFIAYKIEVNQESAHEQSHSEEGTKAECEICGEEYEKKDETNHTGDIYCKACGEKLADEEAVLVIHEHVFGREWLKDEKNHWHECYCGEKAEVEKHIFTDGRCTICEIEEKKESISVKEPVEESAEEQSTDAAPKTGDVSAPYLYLTVMVMSLASIVFALRCKRR